MQKFEMPAMSVEEFEIADVIMTASFVDDTPNCDNQSAIDW